MRVPFFNRVDEDIIDDVNHFLRYEQNGDMCRNQFIEMTMLEGLARRRKLLENTRE